MGSAGGRDDRAAVTGGLSMMEFLNEATDRRDAVIIDRIAPIAREVGLLTSMRPEDVERVDVVVESDDTQDNSRQWKGDRDDD